MLNCAVSFVFGLSGVSRTPGRAAVCIDVHAYDAVALTPAAETASTRNVCLPSGKVPAGYDLGSRRPRSSARRRSSSEAARRRCLEVERATGRGGRIGRAGRDHRVPAGSARASARAPGSFGVSGVGVESVPPLPRPTSSTTRLTTRSLAVRGRRRPSPASPTTGRGGPPPASRATARSPRARPPLLLTDHRGCQRHPDEEQQENSDRPSAPPPNALVGFALCHPGLSDSR